MRLIPTSDGSHEIEPGNYSCESCGFFVKFEGVVMKEHWWTTGLGKVRVSSEHSVGLCVRYPTPVNKRSVEYCGEYQSEGE